MKILIIYFNYAQKINYVTCYYYTHTHKIILHSHFQHRTLCFQINFSHHYIKLIIFDVIVIIDKVTR